MLVATRRIRVAPMLDPHLTRYLLRYRWRYLLGFVALLSASLVVMLPPVALRHAIDSIAEGTTRTQLARYALLILALALVESVLRFAARHLVSGTSRRVEYELRNDLAAKLMELDQSFYVKSHTGDLMARCTNDLQVVRDLVGPALIDILRTFTMILIGFGFLLSIDLRLALIAIAYFPFVAAVIVYFRSTVEAKFQAVQDQFGELANHVQENISGIRTIKAYAQEEAETQAFARANREMLKRSLSWAYYTGAMWPLMAAMAGASTALVLWFGGHDVVSGRITIGEFVQFNSYLGILANPLMSLGWTVNAWQQGTASMRRIADVLTTRPAVREPRTPTRLERVRGDIEFRRVTFGYLPG
ncbi:MAG TPA: ABC transporter transmembrane domain-containing protein, partial [Dehalococcoidia bacterium]|nr:ABC transporter transmembrane domain-containing protein [Dehalococcoidia bacterium]